MAVKGIAAITDALLFLMVASLAAVIMWSRAQVYGNHYAFAVQTRLLKTYSISAVKAMFQTTVSRTAGNDYLLAYLKEDHIRNGEISKEALGIIKDTAEKYFEPLSDRYDIYIMFFQTRGGKQNVGVGIIGGKSYYCSFSDTQLPEVLSVYPQSYSAQGLVVLPARNELHQYNLVIIVAPSVGIVPPHCSSS